MVHRPRNRRLSDAHRAQFARGIVRHWEADDTIQTVAERVDQPQRQVIDAIGDPLRTVSNLWEEGGNSALDIAAVTGYPMEFVKYGIRRAAWASDMQTKKSGPKERERNKTDITEHMRKFDAIQRRKKIAAQRIAQGRG